MFGGDDFFCIPVHIRRLPLHMPISISPYPPHLYLATIVLSVFLNHLILRTTIPPCVRPRILGGIESRTIWVGTVSFQALLLDIYSIGRNSTLLYRIKVLNTVTLEDWN